MNLEEIKKGYNEMKLNVAIQLVEEEIALQMEEREMSKDDYTVSKSEFFKLVEIVEEKMKNGEEEIELGEIQFIKKI